MNGLIVNLPLITITITITITLGFIHITGGYYTKSDYYKINEKNLILMINKNDMNFNKEIYQKINYQVILFYFIDAFCIYLSGSSFNVFYHGMAFEYNTNNLIIFGGYDGSAGQNSIYKYDKNKNEWIILDKKLPYKMAGFGYITTNNHQY